MALARDIRQQGAPTNGRPPPVAHNPRRGRRRSRTSVFAFGLAAITAFGLAPTASAAPQAPAPRPAAPTTSAAPPVSTLQTAVSLAAAPGSPARARVSVTVGPVTYSANPGDFNAGARVDRFTGPNIRIFPLPSEVTIAGVAYRVTEIAPHVFAGTNVAVRLPDTLRVIGDGAFANGDRLGMDLPQGIETIGAEAFLDNNFQRLTIPDTVRTIGDRAFAGNPLISVSLGDSVQRIGAAAFPGRYDLVRLPASVVSVGAGAFASPILQLVTLEGPPPRDLNAAGPALRGSSVASFGTAERVPLISFLPCFAAGDAYPSGYTTPTWRGYPSEVSRFEQCGPETRLTKDTASVSPSVVARAAGHTITAVADGFVPGEDVTPRLNDGAPFAPVRANGAGRVVATVPTPGGLPLGAASVMLTGSQRVASAPFIVTDSLARVGGTNRYGTAEQIAYLGGGASAVIVANGEQVKSGFDALAASYLARKASAPVLLTVRDRLPVETERAACTVLSRSAAPAKYIYILGGADAVSAAVEAKLRTSCRAEVPDVTIVRIAGSNRYETSAKIAMLQFELPGVDPNRQPGEIALRSGGAWRPTAILASGEANADALAAGPIAVSRGLPVLLTSSRGLTEAVAAAIRELGITQVVVLGGPDRIPERIVTDLRSRGVLTVLRIAGADRFETSAKLARFARDAAGMAGDVMGLANGVTGFPDALAAASYLGARGGSLLLTAQQQLPPRVRPQLVGALAPVDWTLVFGSYGSVSDTAVSGLHGR